MGNELSNHEIHEIHEKVFFICHFDRAQRREIFGDCRCGARIHEERDEPQRRKGREERNEKKAWYRGHRPLVQACENYRSLEFVEGLSGCQLQEYTSKMTSAPHDRIVIVLVGTLQPGNIGSVARAMKNMGMSRLRLVSPQCSIDRQAVMMATHGADILESARMYPTMRTAIADAGYVCGTSARDRRRRSEVTPEMLAHQIVGLASTNTVAVVFGPEDRGLTNDELELCNEIITIPTAPGAASLNISHAVMIVCYELFQAATTAVSEEPVELATSASLQGMYDHMRRALLDIGFLRPDNPDIVMGYFKRILSRAGMCEHEVRTLRGIFRQLQWFINRSREKPVSRFKKGAQG
jgi:TrmH family RNA methyltransferase